MQRGEERGEPPALGDGHQPGRWDKLGHGRAEAWGWALQGSLDELRPGAKVLELFYLGMSWPDASEQVLKNQNN